MTSDIKTIEVNKSDLPVSCPPKESSSWNVHPRVFIELSDEKGSSCPYCGTNYVRVNASN